MAYPPIALSACFALLATFAYLYNKVTDLAEDKINTSSFAVTSENIATVRYASLLMLFLPGIFIVLQWPQVFSLYVLLGFISFIYSHRLTFLGLKKRLKDFLLIKNISSSFCWAAVPAFLPTIYRRHHIDEHEILLFISYFAIIFAVQIVMDIRDIEGDRKAGVKTVPNTFGVWVAKIVGLVPILGSLVWKLQHFTIPPAFLAANILTVLAILLIKPNSHAYAFHSIIMIWIVAYIVHMILRAI